MLENIVLHLIQNMQRKLMDLLHLYEKHGKSEFYKQRIKKSTLIQ